MNQHRPNQSTVIIVSGYHAEAPSSDPNLRGNPATSDRHQIAELLPAHEQHKCPVVIVSPEDARITTMGPHICRWAGKRAYTGQESLERQYLQMKLVYEEFPLDFYLWHDSDSVLLSTEVPQYAYDRAREGKVLSNQLPDLHGRVLGYHDPLPQVAMQPPYFFSRASLRAFVERGAGIVACPITPFIDWYFVQLCHQVGLQHMDFEGDGAICETYSEAGLILMDHHVRDLGKVWLHSVKSGEKMLRFLWLYCRRRALPFPAWANQLSAQARMRLGSADPNRLNS